MTGFAEIEEGAVRRFLQTALIVDDRLSSEEEESREENQPETIEEPHAPLVGSVATDAAEKVLDDGPTKIERPGSYIDFKQMSDRFADLGLTLGVLKPADDDDEATVTARVSSAGENVDILIIDWYLDSPEKTTAREALARLIRTGRKGRHLICVYTTHRDLDEIAEEIRGIDGVEQPDEERLVFQSGATQVVLYNKGATEIDESYNAYVVPAGELPQRLNDDFRRLVSGWIPAVTLNALAATRENTHLLLGRLGTELDVGYGGHVIRAGTDATDHLLTSISGEFRSIVEDDERSRDAAGLKTFGLWLDQRDTAGLLSAPKNDTFNLAKNPPAKKNEYSERLVPESQAPDARISDARFAMVLSLRRPYDRPEPRLTLGTVVRDDRDPAGYWLCLQPVCDALRIEGVRGFPFLPLAIHSDVDPKTSFQLVVPPDDEPVCLYQPSRPSELAVVPIKANQDGAVVFERAGDVLKTVVCQDGVHLNWIAQLKPVHAQRVAAEIGSELSRVGLDESEWLRRHSTEKEPKIEVRGWEPPTGPTRRSGAPEDGRSEPE